MWVRNHTNTGMYSIQTHYWYHMNDYTPYLRKYIWNFKVSPKKIMRFLRWKVLLTIILQSKIDMVMWNIAFIIRMNQFDIVFYFPFAKIIWHIVHVTFNIMQLVWWICSETSCVGSIRKIRRKSEWEHVLHFGLYGIYAMLLFLTDPSSSFSCRSSRWLCIGSICDHVCIRKWLPDATIWKR
jgi:hypothetical protein